MHDRGSGILGRLIAGTESRNLDPELQRYLRDVQDHALRITERVEGFREMLQNILGVNLTLVGLQQNEEVKTLTRPTAGNVTGREDDVYQETASSPSTGRAVGGP